MDKVRDANMPETENSALMTLELVHLQLTRQCNLRCWFCGQWGKQGFFADSRGKEMNREEWLKVVGELLDYREQTGEAPSVILWGGEPLMSPYFDEIAELLHKEGFSLGLVTNGTLIHRHQEVCRKCFKRIYLSVDGPRQAHDAIRGQGVFDRVAQNRKLLAGGTAEVVMMSVLTQRACEHLKEHVEALAELLPDALILQEMIGLTGEEILQYRRWMKENFGTDAEDIEGWRNEAALMTARGRNKIRDELPELNRLASFPVSYLPHGEACSRRFCLSPYRHLHVAWNGEVMYCTDFYDFSAGNVKENKLLDLFLNDRSRRFREEIRAGHCVTCEHCSWRNSMHFGL